jgi:hypothetical protein
VILPPSRRDRSSSSVHTPAIRPTSLNQRRSALSTRLPRPHLKRFVSTTLILCKYPFSGVVFVRSCARTLAYLLLSSSVSILRTSCRAYCAGSRSLSSHLVSRQAVPRSAAQWPCCFRSPREHIGPSLPTAQSWDVCGYSLLPASDWTEGSDDAKTFQLDKLKVVYHVRRLGPEQSVKTL